MSSSSAVSCANSNIAFIKYWGDRDSTLRLPANSSISMNLEGLQAKTTVTWDDQLRHDAFVLNGQEQAGEGLVRVTTHLDHLRARLGLDTRASVLSDNNFPTGAGIASSAAAFAALTVAAAAAAGASWSERELTTLARLGSGSAARSVPPGFVVWYAADTHEQSYAETVFPPDHWDLVDVIAIVSSAHKAKGSTEGHRSATTSDLQAARVAGAARRLEACHAALRDHDFDAFAQVVEHDSNLMHAIMMTSRPPLFYWLPASLRLMQLVRDLRADGLRVCYTLDAGPNVHCLCLSSDASQVTAALREIPEVMDTLLARAGDGARLLQP